MRRWARLALSLAVAALALVGYEAARSAAVRGDVVYARYGFLLWTEERLLGRPAAAVAAAHRNRLGDAVFGLIYLSHPAYFFVVMAWLLYRHPVRYWEALSSFALTSAVAVVLYFLVPTAPPWLVVPGLRRSPYPFSSLFGGRVDSNPYASFPSMHVAMATVSAYYLWRASSHRIFMAWPLVMVAATLYTGNHYLLDVIAGLALGLASSIAAEYVLDGRRGSLMS